MRVKDNQKPSAIEALRRAKFKFPGRQKILISSKWGFTKWERDEYPQMRQDGILKADGSGVQYSRKMYRAAQHSIKLAAAAEKAE